MTKHKELSLLQQALFEEKRLAFEERLAAAGRSTLYSDQLSIILPSLKLREKQKNYIDARQFTKYLKGGFQSGKTTSFAANSVLLAYINADKSQVLTISTTQANIQVVYGKKLEELLNADEIPFKSKMIKDSIMETTIYFPENKIGTIISGSGEAINSWIGLTAAATGIDEPFRQPERVYRDGISRASDGNAVLNQIFMAGTPEPETQEWGEDITELEEFSDEKIFVTTMSTWENRENLAPGYIENLMSQYDSETARNYIDGIATSKKGGKMYYMFDPVKNVIEDTEYIIDTRAKSKLLIVYDFNFNPMTALIFLLLPGKAILMEDFKMEASNTWDLTHSIIAWLKENTEPANTSLLITGDRTAIKRDTRGHEQYNPVFNDYQIIQKVFRESHIKWMAFNMRIPSQNPDLVDRVQWVNAALEQRLVSIKKRCKDTIDDLKFVKASKGSGGFKKDKSNPARTHHSDNFDYGLWIMRSMGIFPVYVPHDNSSGSRTVYSDPRRSSI